MTTPEVLRSAPHFTPIDRVDEVGANRNLCLREKLEHLPSPPLQPGETKYPERLEHCGN